MSRVADLIRLDRAIVYLMTGILRDLHCNKREIVDEIFSTDSQEFRAMWYELPTYDLWIRLSVRNQIRIAQRIQQRRTREHGTDSPEGDYSENDT